MSEWNKISGNWSFEERDFTKWGKDRFKDLIQEPQNAKSHNYNGTFKVSKIDGDVFILVSHGQLRYIARFDELKIIFTSTTEGEASGTAMIEIDNDNEYRFTYKTKATDTKSFEDNFKKMIEDALVVLKKELQDKLSAAQ